MAYNPEDYQDDDTDFNPDDFEGDEIDDIDQLWEFDSWDYGDLAEYEFHGTGDTGGEGA